MKNEIVKAFNDRVDAIEEKVERLEKHNDVIKDRLEKFEKYTEEKVEKWEKNSEGRLENFEKCVEEKVEKWEKNSEDRLQKFEKCTEYKLEQLESYMEQRVKEEFCKVQRILERVEESGIENCYGADDNQKMPTVAKPTIKVSTYDGKTSWQVYKTQFSIVAEANGWNPITKARHLAASLRAEAADILRILPEDQQLNFDSLLNALELRFGEKCMKDYSRLQLKSRQQKLNEDFQEFATDIERLSHLAFSDCPTEVRETLSLQYFVDGVRDPEIQKALRMAEIKDLKSALVYAMKFEAAQQATRKDRHPVRGANLEHPSDQALETILKKLEELCKKDSRPTNKIGQGKTVICWRCGAEGHIQRNCQIRQRANDPPKKNDQGN